MLYFRCANKSSSEHRNGYHEEDVPAEDVHVCDCPVRRWNCRCSMSLQVSNSYYILFVITYTYILYCDEIRFSIASVKLICRFLAATCPYSCRR